TSALSSPSHPRAISRISLPLMWGLRPHPTAASRASLATRAEQKSDCRACGGPEPRIPFDRRAADMTAIDEHDVNRADALTRSIGRHPAAALILAIAVIFVVWLVLAPWPAGFEEAFGPKRLFINALFNGITLGGLYFLVASGFTLIFGLMRNVNLAHGSLYLFCVYFGYETAECTGSLLLSYVAAFLCCAVIGAAMQLLIFRRMEGQDLRQTLVTIGLSIVFSDLMVWVWGGNTFQITTPDYLMGPIPTPIVVAVKTS